MLVMLVDDSPSSLRQLQRLAEQLGDVQTLVFTEPEVALAAASREKVDVVVVDYIMPKMDGISFIRRMRAMANYAQVPIIMLTGERSVAVRMEAPRSGRHGFSHQVFRCPGTSYQAPQPDRSVQRVRRLDDQAQWLAAEVEAATRTLLAREEEMIFRLSLAVEYRDNDTGDHTLRVAKYSRMIAEELKLPSEQCRSIYLASPLHDLGKVAVPDRILQKPGRLDEEETRIVRTHAEIGGRILGESTSDLMRLGRRDCREPS